MWHNPDLLPKDPNEPKTLYDEHIAIIVAAMVKFDKRESNFVFDEICAIEKDRARKHLGKASTQRIHIVRKGDKKREESFDRYLDHYLLEPTMARIDIEFGPSPDGYTYRYGYTKDLSKEE